jgi:hypothetical protein
MVPEFDQATFVQVLDPVEIRLVVFFQRKANDPIGTFDVGLFEEIGDPLPAWRYRQTIG